MQLEQPESATVPVLFDHMEPFGDDMHEPTLRILSVYEALDGEANAFHQGSWTVFVRTAGCSVGCQWCDTMYSWSFKRGKDYTIPDLVGEIAKVGSARKVTLTGGEPLEQPHQAIAELLAALVDRKYRVTIETAGTEPVGWLKQYHADVALVLDYKLVSSHSTKPNVLSNFYGLEERHVIKFVVATEMDYREMVAVAKELQRCTHARLVMSPLFKVGKHQSALSLADWVARMKADGLSALGVGLNLQMHKMIYPDDARDEEAGGVDYSKLRA